MILECFESVYIYFLSFINKDTNANTFYICLISFCFESIYYLKLYIYKLFVGSGASFPVVPRISLVACLLSAHCWCFPCCVSRVASAGLVDWSLVSALVLLGLVPSVLNVDKSPITSV